MTQGTKQKPNKHSGKLLSIMLVLILAIGLMAGVIAITTTNRTKSYQACFLIKEGDVSCANYDFSKINTTDLPQINGQNITRITAAPNFSYYIAAIKGSGYRDDPKYLLDENYNIVREINATINTYDMLQTVWTKDGSFAFFHDDVGFLYRYNTATGEQNTLNDSRLESIKDETFEQNKRGDIGLLAMTPDEKLVFTVNDDMDDRYSLYTMDNDGTNPKQLVEDGYIANIAVRRNGDVLYSVDKTKESPEDFGLCASEECQLYSVNPKTAESREITGDSIQFWGFTYDAKTDTAFLVRGPGGSVKEVFSGNVDRLKTIEQAHRITLDGYAKAQGDYSLIPMGKTRLAIADAYKQSEGVKLYDLKSGKQQAAITKQMLDVSHDSGGGVGFVRGAWKRQ